MIITSWLDNDFYQFTMSYYAWKNHKDLEVKYKFRNRTFEVPLWRNLDTDLLIQEIAALNSLDFSTDEIDYLSGLGYFEEDYLNELITDPPSIDIYIKQDGDYLVIEYSGLWWQAMFFETPILAIINEIYFSQLEFEIEGYQRLRDKATYLLGYPDLKFVEFGTRRRWSKQWQMDLLAVMATNYHDMYRKMLGTSNVALARQFNLAPKGTMAHQLFMVETALHANQMEILTLDGIVNSQLSTLLNWETLYGSHNELLTFLPDTFGTVTFFAPMNDLSHESWDQNVLHHYLQNYKGIRQDSGDPIRFGNAMLHIWEAYHIDPQEKTLFFSDSLDVRKMSILYETFNMYTNVVFGWGTNLTNDLGPSPLSIVIKPDAVKVSNEWVPCVKLSDDITKATGDPLAVANYTEAARIGTNP